jgi:putative endonuclease
LGSAFVRKYHATQLVYCEATDRPLAAITREKQIKAGSAVAKRDLISGQNPEWRDLYDDLA